MGQHYLPCCLLVVAWAAAAGAAAGAGEEAVSSLQSSVQLSNRDRLPEDARLLAAQSRKTVTTITTSTTTAPVFCFSTINTAPCGKRRRKRVFPLRRSVSPVSGGTGLMGDGRQDLDSSLDSPALDDPADERPRLSYTVWWSQTTTLTHISTVNSGITVSLSYFCSIVGAAYPAACAG